MGIQQQNSFIGKFLASRTFVAVGIVILVLLTLAFSRAYYQNRQIREEIRRLQAEADKLESKKLQTLELLSYVQSPAYVEEKARTELNLIMEGEKVTVVPQTDNNVDGQAEKNVIKSKNISNPKQWWNYFFK